MYSVDDFKNAALPLIAARPAAAAAFRAGDPRFKAQIDAMATMLAMMSAQVDVAEVEPFVKARDGTVLADCAVKGILPLAKSARVSVTVSNPTGAAISIASGRVLLDSQGRRYVVDASVSVPANGSIALTATQRTIRTETHTVGAAAPFYQIQVPLSAEDNTFICGLDVSDTTGTFLYKKSFYNVAAGERSYHVETDEFRRMFVRFGFSDASNLPALGYQVQGGDVFTLQIAECAGEVTLGAGEKFQLEYLIGVNDQDLALVLDSMISSGAFPPSIETLRIQSKYPAIYDDNAVHLGNFDFVIRRALGGLPISFLSVWNEQIEESVRGANVANINRLFVSYYTPTQSGVATEAQITQTVRSVDDSYKINWVARRDVPIPLTIVCRVSVVHDPADVEAQVRALLLGDYGISSINASRGQRDLFRYGDIYDKLKKNIPALQDQFSDLALVVGSTPTALPEDFRYLDNSTLAVTVTVASQNTGLWNQ